MDMERNEEWTYGEKPRGCGRGMGIEKEREMDIEKSKENGHSEETRKGHDKHGRGNR